MNTKSTKVLFALIGLAAFSPVLTGCSKSEDETAKTPAAPTTRQKSESATTSTPGASSGGGASSAPQALPKDGN